MPGLFVPGEYAAKSSEAHFVLGLGIVLLVLVWAKRVLNLSSAENESKYFLVAGIIEILMGGYLCMYLRTCLLILFLLA